MTLDLLFHLHDPNLRAKAEGEEHAEEKARPDGGTRNLKCQLRLDILKDFRDYLILTS